MKFWERLKWWLWGAPKTISVVVPVQVPPPTPSKKNKAPKPKEVKDPKTECAVTGKLCRTEAAAKKRAEESRPKLRAYKCQFCPYWHLTHKKQR
jgi:hypothetical protein